MNHEQAQDLLSAWLDGELPADERMAVEAHLAACPPCRALADDLRRVTRVAAALPANPPSRNLWPGIEARIRPASQAVPIDTRRRRPLPVQWVGLVAASLVVGVVLGNIGGRAAVRPDSTGVEAVAATAAPRSVGTTRPATLDAGQLSQSTGVAVGQLEQLLLTQTRQLDTSTVRVLAQNLARIDSAIADAERALAQDPSNAYVSRHLAATTKRKVDMLRRVAALTQPRS